MSTWKSQLNKPYLFYWLTFRWSLSAWGPWHLTGKGWSTGSPDFCTSPLWSCALLCVLQGTGSSLRSGRKDRDLRWRDSEEQDLQVFPSLWAVLCCQQAEQLSWISELSNGTTSFLAVFFFSPQPTLFCCYFNSKVCSHDTHMLSTSVTNRNQFVDYWIYQALLWYSGCLQPTLSLVMHKWKRCSCHSLSWPSHPPPCFVTLSVHNNSPNLNGTQKVYL